MPEFDMGVETERDFFPNSLDAIVRYDKDWGSNDWVRGYER